MPVQAAQMRNYSHSPPIGGTNLLELDEPAPVGHESDILSDLIATIHPGSLPTYIRLSLIWSIAAHLFDDK